MIRVFCCGRRQHQKGHTNLAQILRTTWLVSSSFTATNFHVFVSNHVWWGRRSSRRRGAISAEDEWQIMSFIRVLIVVSTAATKNLTKWIQGQTAIALDIFCLEYIAWFRVDCFKEASIKNPWNKKQKLLSLIWCAMWGVLLLLLYSKSFLKAN